MLPFLAQCQKLNLNVSEVYIEDRFIRINASVENRTSEVIAIHAHNVGNNASNYYRIESKNQGLDVHSNLVNGARPEIISINPKSSVPFRILFAIRKANRGIYSCKLVPTDIGKINCASFEVRIERPIIEKHSNLISKSDRF